MSEDGLPFDRLGPVGHPFDDGSENTDDGTPEGASGPGLDDLFDLPESPAEPRGPSGPKNTAVVCEGTGRTRLVTHAIPKLESGEILLRLRVCGLCGTDLFKLTTGTAEPGSVLGHELIGEVESVASDVSRFSPGDRVVVPHHLACLSCELCRRDSETKCARFQENLMDPGGFADRIRIHRRAVRHAAQRVPNHVPDDAMVFMEPAACVLRGVRAAHLPKPPGCAVVLGAGSMGLLHLLVLHALFPELTVGVIDPMEERRQLAEALGAQWTSAPVLSDVLPIVDGATEGLGADAIFDTVGGAQLLSSAVRITRPGGTVILFAHAGAQEKADFELNPFFKAEQRVVGTYSGGLEDQRRVWELIASCRLDPSPLVTHRLPLSRFDEAVQLCRERRALKVLLTPDRADSGGPP